MNAGAAPRWGSKERPWPISVGDLDSWSYYQGPGRDLADMTDADFRKRLDREQEESAPLIIGKCFHAAIEEAMIAARVTGAEVILDTFTGRADGHAVEFATAGRVSGADVSLNTALQQYTLVEQDLELVFDTPAGWVHLRGVKDGLRGGVIRDIKTTKSFSAEKYQDAWQWRAYLQACGAQYKRFDYLVFTVSHGKKQAAELAAGRMAQVLVTGFHPMSVYRYPNMMMDLQGVASALAAYLGEIEWEPPAKRQMQIF